MGSVALEGLVWASDPALLTPEPHTLANSAPCLRQPELQLTIFINFSSERRWNPQPRFAGDARLSQGVRSRCFRLESDGLRSFTSESSWLRTLPSGRCCFIARTGRGHQRYHGDDSARQYFSLGLSFGLRPMYAS